MPRAWGACGDHGFGLGSVDAQLRRIGAAFYLVGGGAGYKPGAAQFGDSDYRLTGPDGTAYVIDSVRGTVAIESADGRLMVGDGGVTALGGASLQFVRDAAGRITRVSAADGTSIVYEYDADGRMSDTSNLATGEGER